MDLAMHESQEQHVPDGAEPISVLHVDDDDAFADTLVTYLEEVVGGFSVCHAPDGSAALDTLSPGIDCVVSDYQMPGMDGLSLLDAVHDRQPELPFILLTAEGSESVAREAIEAEVTSYLPKRGSREGFERLADRIREAVSQARSRVSYREVFDKAGVGLTIRDTDTAELVAVNDRYCEILGYDRETLLGRSFDDLSGAVNADAGERAMRTFERAVETGSQRFERPTQDADGDVVWLDVRYEIAEIEGTRRVLGSVHDVTERKEREEELESQNEKIQALHDAAARIEACEDAESVYENIVRAAEEILEYDIVIADGEEDGLLVPKAISTAMSDDEYFETTSVDADDNIAAEVFRTQEPRIVDDLSTLDVTPADTEFRSVITVPVGEYGVFQAVARDVAVFDETDLELTELLLSHGRETLSRLEREWELRARTRELKREKERSEVFGNAVSHDLRNPLNVATGHLGLARQDRDDEHLEAVASALDRMEAITEDVLTLAREGATVSGTEWIDLGDVAEDCWGNVDTQEATLRVASPCQFAADPRRLQHIVENLFRNAIEHGGVDVRITVGPLVDAEGFYIADDGPGIPEGSRDDVFDPGYSTADDGTGFGLAIVQEMAVAHGWETAAAESAEGGARFEFSNVETEQEDDDADTDSVEQTVETNDA